MTSKTNVTSDPGASPRLSSETLRERAETLREELAALCHEQWSEWMRYLFSRLITRGDGLLIPAEWVERWTRQMNMSYADLSEAEKDSDRKEADRILAIVNAALVAHEQPIPVRAETLLEWEQAKTKAREAAAYGVTNTVLVILTQAGDALLQHLDAATREVATLRGERSAYDACPKCGATENQRDLGGNERCFHCECGFIQCDPRDPTWKTRAESAEARADAAEALVKEREQEICMLKQERSQEERWADDTIDKTLDAATTLRERLDQEKARADDAEAQLKELQRLINYDGSLTTFDEHRDILVDAMHAMAVHDTAARDVEEAVTERLKAEARLTTLTALLRELVAKWRESAGWEFEHGSPEYGKGLDQCADELDARLASPPETP